MFALEDFLSMKIMPVQLEIKQESWMQKELAGMQLE